MVRDRIRKAGGRVRDRAEDVVEWVDERRDAHREWIDRGPEREQKLYDTITPSWASDLREDHQQWRAERAEVADEFQQDLRVRAAETAGAAVGSYREQTAHFEDRDVLASPPPGAQAVGPGRIGSVARIGIGAGIGLAAAGGTPGGLSTQQRDEISAAWQSGLGVDEQPASDPVYNDPEIPAQDTSLDREETLPADPIYDGAEAPARSPAVAARDAPLPDTAPEHADPLQAQLGAQAIIREVPEEDVDREADIVLTGDDILTRPEVEGELTRRAQEQAIAQRDDELLIQQGERFWFVEEQAQAHQPSIETEEFAQPEVSDAELFGEMAHAHASDPFAGGAEDLDLWSGVDTIPRERADAAQASALDLSQPLLSDSPAAMREPTAAENVPETPTANEPGFGYPTGFGGPSPGTTASPPRWDLPEWGTTDGDDPEWDSDLGDAAFATGIAEADDVFDLDVDWSAVGLEDADRDGEWWG